MTHTREQLIAAVRADPHVGRGSMSTVDECYTDAELAEALRLDGRRSTFTTTGAVREARALNALLEENFIEQRAATGLFPDNIEGGSLSLLA